jgi:hypothetical protein
MPFETGNAAMVRSVHPSVGTTTQVRHCSGLSFPLPALVHDPDALPKVFFFEGTPDASAPNGPNGSALSMAQIDDFVSDSTGLRLIGAFMRIDNAAVRRRIVMLVQEIAGDDGN